MYINTKRIVSAYKRVWKKKPVYSCLVCGSTDRYYYIGAGGEKVSVCNDCGAS